MLSSPMIDLIVDKRFFTLSVHDPNVQARNRRAMHIAALISGSFTGAFLHKAKGPELTIMVALVFKVGIAVALGVIPGEARCKVDDAEEKAISRIETRSNASTVPTQEALPQRSPARH